MRPSGAVALVDLVNPYRFAVEGFALKKQEGDRSERVALDSLTPNAALAVWSQTNKGWADEGSRPNNYSHYNN